MHHLLRRGVRTVGLYGFLLLLSIAAFGQSPTSIRGQVTDPSGAAVPKANVIATGPNGTVKVATTNDQGVYTIGGVPAGQYTIRANAPGFGLFERTGVDVVSGRALTLDISLTVNVDRQEVTVTETAKVDVDPSNNAGALVLKATDLDALSDNPDDLASDLQALAGPSAGPNGGQIYIDGFTGGRLPPKESIREVRINSNPFSSEYDRLGFGRIEIFTKPGTDKYRGQGFFNYGNEVFNSRNPFGLTRAPYELRQFGGNLSGPISKKSSFFIDVERSQRDEATVINALTLDQNFVTSPFIATIGTPIRRTTISPRIDYALNANNTLVARYTWATNSQLNEGLNEFSLPSRAINGDNTEQTVQVTETAVLSAKAINETRFQYIRRRNNQSGNSNGPTISVLDAFTGGGAPISLAFVDEDRYEVQNNTSLTLGTHLTKFGFRLRGVDQQQQTTQNFNGTFTFSTLDAYRITQQGIASGLSLAQIRAQGGGPSQFSLSAGNPLAGVNQFDIGLYVQDDWRLRPNFTLSLGLRYETQNNIGDHLDLAPRIGFAWGIGQSKGRGPKAVLRGGFGLFYERFSEDYTLTAIQQNGINQQLFFVPGAAVDFYPNIPTPATLAGFTRNQTIREIDQRLNSPYLAQSVIGIEKQLPKNISVAVNYTNTRGIHYLRSRNINAPLPGTYNPAVANSGVFPFGPTAGNLYLYESTGIFNQNQLITNINARVSPRVTLFGFYTYGHAKGNTDGAGTFPVNQYDVSTEYGRSSFDVRHRAFIGGSLTGPYATRFSPFIVMSSGTPFNITLGRDLNGDTVFNDRPTFADASTVNPVVTPWGTFDTNPKPGQTLIPRNYGEGPGQFFFNMRVSRTWGFGERATSSRGPGSDAQMGGPGGGGGMRGGRGGGGGGMRGPGGFGGGGGGRGGPGGMFGDSGTNHRYNLTLSANARNLFNRVNLATPIGTLSSQLFGVSNALARGFGGSAAANRRLELQLRFTF